MFLFNADLNLGSVNRCWFE